MILFCIANFNGNDQDHQIFPESGEAIGDWSYFYRFRFVWYAYLWTTWKSIRY
jgi:hypothetical protein